VSVRVALLDLPQMLSEIVKEILDQAEDVTVVDAGSKPETDVFIVGAQEDELPPVGLAQLERQPKAKVLTIDRNGRDAHLYELRPHKTPLGELSADTLLAAVGAARAKRG
jgi:hypothetical protein